MVERDDCEGMVKLPPNCIEAEMSILGAIFLENNLLPALGERLLKEHFYRDVHRKIYAAMLDLANMNIPTDLVTVTNELRKRKELESVGGGQYLAMLVDFVPTASNVAEYVRIVKEKHMIRTMINAATKTLELAHDNCDMSELLKLATQAIFDIEISYGGDSPPIISPIKQNAIRAQNGDWLNVNSIDFVIVTVQTVPSYGGLNEEFATCIGMKTGYVSKCVMEDFTAASNYRDQLIMAIEKRLP